MSIPTTFDAIEGHLKSSWVETDIVFENEEYQTPATPTHFVYVEVVGDLLEQDTFGDPGRNEWLETGALYLHVMTPKGVGSRDARAIGQRLTYLFREQPFDNIHFREMSIGAGEPGQNFPNYFAMTVTIAWDRRDISSIP